MQETGDPDDVITLLLLCAWHNITLELVAVTVVPGSREQVELVRWILGELGLLDTVRVGATAWPRNSGQSGCVEGAFYSRFGRQATLDHECEEAGTMELSPMLLA